MWSRLPGAHRRAGPLVNGRQLANVEPADESTRRIEAAAVLGAGALASFTLLLFATGRTREAYALAFTSTWLGAIFGALRVYSSR